MTAESYAVEEIARRAGVSRRTVRYYVQEGIVPPPVGAGRGARYGRAHLDRLLEARDLRRRGASLEEIRGVLAGRSPTTDPAGAHHAYRREWNAHAEPVPAPVGAEQIPPPVLRRGSWTRLELLPGLELHVSDARRLPSPRKLGELADWCRGHFQRRVG